MITGGASGLGEASVRKLVQEGANVAVLDRDVEKGEQLVKDLGSNVIFCEMDATNEQSIKTAVEKARENRLRVNVTLQALGLTHV